MFDQDDIATMRRYVAAEKERRCLMSHGQQGKTLEEMHRWFDRLEQIEHEAQHNARCLLPVLERIVEESDKHPNTRGFHVAPVEYVAD
ncbi:MAG TPA: hypothetical protein VFM97_00485 [Gammaproteobacteria bacterium]|nr:hypothetical protein [Gammaproteobacteria bacterium]